jgi:hypothetical protein
LGRANHPVLARDLARRPSCIDGGIAPLDRERARELPVAGEILKLTRQRPGLLERIAPGLARRAEDPRLVRKIARGMPLVSRLTQEGK